MSEVRRRTIMGYWDCPYCDRKKIEGTTYDCPGCGHQRGEDTQIYLDLNNKKYIDNHVKKGADWYCEYCHAYNPADSMYCSNCGGAREEMDKNYFTFNKKQRRPLTDKTDLDAETKEEIRLRLEDVARELEETTKKAEKKDSSVNHNTPNVEDELEDTLQDKTESINEVPGFVPITDQSVLKETQKNTHNVSILACLRVVFAFLISGLTLVGTGFSHVGSWIFSKLRKVPWLKIFKRVFLVALGMIAVWCFVLAVRPKYVKGTVEEVRWTNTVYVQELKTFNESDWDLPRGARLKYTNEEVRRYEQVIDHYNTVTKSRIVEDGGHTVTETKTRTVEDGYTETVSYESNGDGTWDEVVNREPKYRTETYTEEHWVKDYKTEYYTEDEPVYKRVPVYETKYYYEIDRWVFDHTVIATNTDRELYWPEVVLSEKERESGRTTTYTIKLTYEYKDKETMKLFDISETTWKDLKEGDRIEAKLSALGNTLKDYTKLD